MTRCDFYLITQNFDNTDEIKIITIDGEEIVGVIDTMNSDFVVVDETSAFGDMRVVDYKNIKEVKKNIEKIYGVYANTEDITFIMKDVFEGEKWISTEVVGFVYGNEVDNPEMLQRYNGKLKAEFEPLPFN